MITYHPPSKLPEGSVQDHPADRGVEAFCPRCDRAVDAVCPHCKAHVEAGGPEAGQVLSRREYYRRLITLIQNSRNSKFMCGCYLIATGDAHADGVSMTEFGATWGVTKAAVSKHCRLICAYLGIPPSQYMRKEKTAAKFKGSNRRPRKMETSNSKHQAPEKHEAPKTK